MHAGKLISYFVELAPVRASYKSLAHLNRLAELLGLFSLIFFFEASMYSSRYLRNIT